MRKKDRIFIIESLQHLQYGDMQEGPMHAIASSIVHAVHFDKWFSQFTFQAHTDNNWRCNGWEWYIDWYM